MHTFFFLAKATVVQHVRSGASFPRLVIIRTRHARLLRCLFQSC